MSNQLEYNINDQNDLDEIGETLPNEQPKNNKSKIAIIILSSIIAILVIGMGVYFCLTYIKKDSNDNNNDNNNNDNNNNDNNKNNQFRIYYNISYFNKTTEKIENSFRTGGDHPEFGNINEGKDYSHSDSNDYSMIIPQSAYDNKEGYNKIFLWIHGGLWIALNKDTMLNYCKLMAGYGYISATIGYTLLTNNSTDHKSMYRIVDEITACQKSILQFLEKENIKTNNIQIVLGGMSAGGHLSLLYGYFMNEPIIPIIFIVNIVGPVTIDPTLYKENRIFNDTLENLEPATVDNAIEFDRLKQINAYIVNHANLTKVMNYMIGYKYNETVMNEIIKNEVVDTNNDKYKTLLEEANAIMSPLNFIKNDSVPTINYYSGNDDAAGEVHYSLLKKNILKLVIVMI